MKKTGFIKTVCLWLALLLAAGLVTGCAEEAPALPGWDSSKLINETLEDGTVAVLGVESEPQAARWNTYEPALREGMAGLYLVESPEVFDIQGPFYSDGSEVYVFPINEGMIRIYTRGAEKDAQVEKVVVSVPDGLLDEEEASYYVTEIAYVAWCTLSEVSPMGQSIVSLACYEPMDFAGARAPWWTENGWELSFGTDGFNLFASMEWTGEFEKEAEAFVSLAPFSEPLPALPGELTAEEFLGRFNSLAFMFGIGAEEPQPAEDFAGLSVSLGGEDRLCLELSDPDRPERVTAVRIECPSGDTVVAYGALLAALYGTGTADTDELYLIMCLTGTSGSWNMLCELTPYVRVNGAVAEAALSADDHPVAVVYGAR